MTLPTLAERLCGEIALNHQVMIAINELVIAVHSNSERLIEKLHIYFRPFSVRATSADTTIKAIDGVIDLSDLPWMDWPREAGKRGRKEAYIDGDGFRLVRKIKTGVCILQTQHEAIIRGACTDNDNQVINVINSQYLTDRQQRGDQLCHAAACQYGDRAVAFAGLSGGGKSTLMLHCLNDPELLYLSNDRLLIDSSADQPIARGIPKLPRVNPGTILNDTNLRAMLTEEQRQHYDSVPISELWDLEDKFDVMVDQIYGENRLSAQGTLKLLFILNWKRSSEEPTVVTKIQIDERKDLLSAVMKSPGPFYIEPDGQPVAPQMPLKPDAYIRALELVDVYEISGAVDFQRAQSHVLQLLKADNA